MKFENYVLRDFKKDDRPLIPSDRDVWIGQNKF